jgi:hypothetical protein
MFKNLFKVHKPPVLGRWSVDTATANTRAALANCDNCGTCGVPTRTLPSPPAMAIVGDDVIDLRGAMLSGSMFLYALPEYEKNILSNL